MDNKLGFTFYPKDWWTSESYFELSPTQRYYYLECLFIMYSNDGFMKTQKTQFENRIRTQVLNEDWEMVTNRFEIIDGLFTHVSVNKRLRKAITNRENGKKGGRPPKPKEPKIETQNNPPSEREREREREYNDEAKPPTPSTAELIKNLRTDIETAKGVGGAEFLTISECRILYDANYQSQKVGVCTPSGWNFEKLKLFQDEFDLHISKTLTHKVISDYAKHFANWTAKLTTEQKQSILQKSFIPKKEKSIEETYG